MAKQAKLQARRRAPLTDRRLRDALERVDSLMERRRWAEAHALLIDLDRTYPQRQEILRDLVEVAFHLGDLHTYQYGCETLYRLCPGDPDLPYMLTRAYLQNEWGGLALSMARRALAHDPVNEKAESTRRGLPELERLVEMEISRLGLDGPDSLECLSLHDLSRALLAQGRFAKSLEAAEKLLERRPHFTAAYNNGAEAACHEGRLAQAIDLERRLLAFDPENVFALANLVRFLSVSGQGDEARRQAERMKSLNAPAKDHAVKQAEALAWLGDDAGVLEVFERGRKLAQGQSPQDDALLFHLAAVAAYRLDQKAEANRHWQAALRAVPRFELAQSNLDDLAKPVAERNAPWYYPLQYFVARNLIDGLLRQVKAEGEKGDNEVVRRKGRDYLAKHPELEGLVPLLLDRSDGSGRELALHLAGWLGTPAMLQAVRDFALGPRGSDSLRMRAVQLAQDAGLFPEGPQPLWINGERRDLAFRKYEIHTEPVEHVHEPGVFALLTQGIEALHAGAPTRAEEVLRRALAIDPNDPLVMNNLALACAEQGRTEEAVALSLRLHERHPDYLFGRTTMANLSVKRGDLDRARELLKPLLERQRLHGSEFSALAMAQINLHLAEGNPEAARQLVKIWRQVAPDHPALAQAEARVRRGG